MVGGNHVSHQHINQLPILNQDTFFFVTEIKIHCQEKKRQIQDA